MSKFLMILFLGAFILFVAPLLYILFASVPRVEKITWGVDFSQMQAESLKLNWKEAYHAMLDDLGVKHIKLHTQWDWIEGTQGVYYFDDLDWQITEAEKYGADVIFVTGMKTGRWPECHLPPWTRVLSKEEQQKVLLEYIGAVVDRYKTSPAIIAWQAENEPLFRFGECPWYDKEFLKKEITLIHSFDPSRPVVITDSGEQSLWFEAARLGDIVGTTLYRKVWVHLTDRLGFYLTFHIPPKVYGLKAAIVKKFFGKKVINIELQAEPWVSNVYSETPLEVQEKSMNLAQFKRNVEFAKKTGLDTFYFWGAEWWYWLKVKHDKPEIWDEARKLF